MKDRQSITYIKKEKEKTVFLNKLTEKLIFTRLAENIDIPYKEGKISSHKLLPEVTFIHIKNYNFKDSIQFLGIASFFNFNNNNNNSKTIILENCTFYNNIFFHHIENIKIITPIFKNNSTIYVSAIEGIENYSNVEIDLTNSKGEVNLELENCDELKLNSSEVLKKINLASSNTVIINNMNNTIVENLFDIKNLKLIDSNITKFISNKNGVVSFKVFSLDHFKITNQITLENSKLVLPRNFEVKNNQVISLNNSSITSNYSLKIPNTNFIDFIDSNEDSILDTSSYIETKELIINNQPYKSNILTIKDKQELTPTITYIKNNKKETLDFLDRYLVNPTVLLISPILIYNETLVFSNDAELMHLKNITFKNIKEIKINENQTLILENCEFQKECIYYSLQINGGNYKLINPTLNGSIIATNINNLIIDFTNELSKDNIFIKTINVKNFIINNHNNLKGLDISSKQTYLKNFGLLGDFVNIDTENLLLENTSLTNEFTNNHPKTKIRRK